MISRLDDKTFLQVVNHTPLVSIDLLIKNYNDGSFLLGQRCNEPARGFWFVPGGRIFKNETLATAFQRLTHEELGCEQLISTATFSGCYEHFYQENFAGADNINTHYVVLAYELKVAEVPGHLPAAQHSQFNWFSIEEILHNKLIHQFTRDYFTT